MDGAMRWGVGPVEEGNREVRGQGGSGNERWGQHQASKMSWGRSGQRWALFVFISSRCRL